MVLLEEIRLTLLSVISPDGVDCVSDLFFLTSILILGRIPL